MPTEVVKVKSLKKELLCVAPLDFHAMAQSVKCTTVAVWLGREVKHVMGAIRVRAAR